MERLNKRGYPEWNDYSVESDNDREEKRKKYDQASCMQFIFFLIGLGICMWICSYIYK